MRIRRRLIIVGMGLLLLPAARVSRGDPASDRAELEKVSAQFQAILDEATDLKEQYNKPSATDEDRKKLQERFNELGRRRVELLPKLNNLTEKVYLANPRDSKLGDMMFENVKSALATDDFEDALRLAKLLIDNNYPHSEVANFAAMAALNLSDYDAAEKYLKQANSNGTLDKQAQSLLEQLPLYRAKWNRELAFRADEAKANDLPRVRLTIGDHAGKKKGEIVIELFENEAPNTVANFINLVEKHFYDGLSFHRVLQGFMAQGGDPDGKGTGGPGYHIRCECYEPNHREHFRGTLSMAHAGRDTGGSQFFLCFAPAAQLDGRHTAFGRVIEGMDVLAKIQRIDPEKPVGIQPDKIIKAEVVRKRQHAYEPKTVP